MHNRTKKNFAADENHKLGIFISMEPLIKGTLLGGEPPEIGIMIALA